MTEELKAEGIAREFINRIQNLRKDSGLELTDKIRIQIPAESPFENEILNNRAYISSEVLSDEIEVVHSLANGTEIEIDDQPFRVHIEKTNT